MKTWVVIPSRYGSTRFPGKPLALISGKPLLQRVVEQAQKIRGIEGVLVATDDDRIFNLASNLGVRAVMTNTNHSTGTDRIQQAISEIDCDLVVNLQGDEPLFNPLWIEKLIEFFSSDLQMATLAHPIQKEEFNSLNSVKVILNKKSEAIYFSRLQIPFSRLAFEEAQTCVYKHIGIYAYRKEFLATFCLSPQSEIEKAESLEQLRAIDLGEKIKVLVVEESSQGVDVPEDIAKVEALIID